ncbi:hypothetical protein RCF71_04895 [Staphylococcus chromogenes]|uniref:hypothetical protein n=1 Tax=Staphylococcus chromogenes TaxID=46126 RepID=UPI003B0021C9
MFKKKSKKSYSCHIETNVSDLRYMLNNLKSLVARTENKQEELKEKVKEYESLVRQTENTIKEINKFKLKSKVIK